MSGQDANFVTHDSLGKEPRNGLVKFEVEWKNSGDASTRENAASDGKPGVTIINIDPRGKYDWDSFKYLLPRGDVDPQIIYTDSDGDEIPIESQCEFEEALRFAQDRAKRLRNVHLILKKQSKSETTKRNIEIQPKTQTISHETSNAMPPMKLDDVAQDYRRIPPRPEINCVVTQPGRSNDERAPKWFTSYMQTMKEEIIAEVSTRVTKTVIDALQKKRSGDYDTAISHPRTAHTKCLGDSDSDDDASARYSRRPPIEITSPEDIPCQKRNTKGPSGPGTRRCDSSSPHRYRSNEKKRRKHKSKVSPSSKLETLNLEGDYISLSFKRRQGEKTATKKRDDENVEIAVSQGSGNFGREQISVSKNLGESEIRDEELDTHYRRMIASGLGVKSVTMIDSDNLFDLKLRLATLSNGQQVETIPVEEAVLTDCSVIGNDILDRANDRVPEYCVLSDSDNISIISDVSHTSDMQRISNRFEMILQPCMNYEDEDNDQAIIATEFMENQRQKNHGEYHDNTRDSSSFELLSEPPSPPLSIHMDEDHFSHGKNETNDYNINDDMTMDKRGNQNKIEVCPLAIDKQGKIYRHNIIESDEEFSITLENRTDGAYSFVAETLPGPTRESTIQTKRYDSSTNETRAATDGVDDEETTTQIPNGTSPDGSSSSDAFHDSTQSFHSHTTPQTENERRDFTGYPSTTGNDENTGTSTRFVDHNASKGLGDTRQSSPKKQSSTSNKPREFFFRVAESTTEKQSSHDPGHGSARRNGNTRVGDHSEEFNRSTTRKAKMMNDLAMNDFDNTVDSSRRGLSSPEAALSSPRPRSSSPEPLEMPLAFVEPNVDKILRLKTRKVADKPNFSRVMY